MHVSATHGLPNFNALLPDGWEASLASILPWNGMPRNPEEQMAFNAMAQPVRVSKIGKISKILQIFSGLVLGCIKTKFCKKICV